jgi:hypothetical protein
VLLLLVSFSTVRIKSSQAKPSKPQPMQAQQAKQASKIKQNKESNRLACLTVVLIACLSFFLPLAVHNLLCVRISLMNPNSTGCHALVQSITLLLLPNSPSSSPRKTH